jgi:hypothetical protein
MSDWIVNWLLAHKGFLEGLAVGYATGHVPQIVGYLFHYAMMIPWLRSAVVSDPAKAKALVAQIEQELEKDIDAEAAQK